MLKIACCDNDSDVIDQIDHLLSNADIIVEWDMFSCGTELLDYMGKNNVVFHIFIMDIEMPGLNGIETARKIREADQNAIIIFLTDYKEYVYHVFEVLPFRFLQKPVEDNRFVQTIVEAIAHIQKANTLFFFQVGHVQMQRSLGEIISFEGAGRKVILCTLTEQIVFYGKSSDVWKNIDHHLFTRPHASYLVNMEFIRSVQQSEVIMAGNIAVPVSKRFRNVFKADYMKFVERRNGIL